ncbi:hypothetical protein RJ55_08656 [Drechmeria coniospora]|nr:hypothetical protein RJ55_08656 [Drechmeria coniospora]
MAHPRAAIARVPLRISTFTSWHKVHALENTVNGGGGAHIRVHDHEVGRGNRIRKGTERRKYECTFCRERAGNGVGQAGLHPMRIPETLWGGGH